MIRKANQQVNPKVAALVILSVLVLIQVVWWRGLVMKKPGKGGGGGGGGGNLRPGPPTLEGRKDVTVVTLAGAPDPGDADGPGHAARFDGPLGIALDGHGNLYVADSRNHRIRRVSPDGHTTTFAGGQAGYVDGPVATARFNCPCGVAVGQDGAVYVADTGNDRIRLVKAGMVTTLAGNGPAANDRLHAPCAVAYVGGSAPVLLVADSLNRRVQTLDLSGKVMSTWSVSGTPLGLLATVNPVAAVSGAGIVQRGGKTVAGIPIDAGAAEAYIADFTLRHPVALAPGPAGWFMVDGDQACVFYVHGGRAELIAGMSRGRTLAADWRDADGEKAKFGHLGGLAADGRGRLYVSDFSNNSIRSLTLPADLRGRQEARP